MLPCQENKFLLKCWFFIAAQKVVFLIGQDFSRSGIMTAYLKIMVE